MNMWLEDVHVDYFRVCLREVKTFDGKHKGIELVSHGPSLRTARVDRVCKRWLQFAATAVAVIVVPAFNICVVVIIVACCNFFHDPFNSISHYLFTISEATCCCHLTLYEPNS